MRTSGLCLALIASAQLVLFSTPAFAQGTDAPADAPATAAPAATAPAAPAAAASDGTVPIHINSESTVTLQHRSAEAAPWETLCTSPCDTKGPVADQYQVTGDNLNASKPFMIDSTRGKVVLEVSPGSHSKAAVGTGLLVAGAIVTVAGLVVAIAASSGPLHADSASPGTVSGTGATDNGTTNIGRFNVLVTAAALIFVGVTVGLYGAGTMLANNHTGVDGDVAKDQPARGQNDLPSKLAEMPIPAHATAFNFPIIQGTF